MENELYHWGIKGMKWGQRRFQNKDGSLTPAGKKRYSESSDSDTDSEESSNSYKSARKSVKSMSDTDLDAAITRLRKEQTYKQLQEELNPTKVSAAKKAATAMFDKAIAPALLESSKGLLKDFVTDRVSKKLGLKKEETDAVYKALKKEADQLNLKKQIAEAKDYLNNQKTRTADAELRRTADQYRNKRDIAMAKDFLARSESAQKAADYVKSKGGSPDEATIARGLTFINDTLDLDK